MLAAERGLKFVFEMHLHAAATNRFNSIITNYLEFKSMSLVEVVQQDQFIKNLEFLSTINLLHLY
jgi:hypothetical protein